MRRIVGKTVAAFLKEEIKEAAGPLQVCAGSEAAIHAMSQVFAEEGTDGILLIDASNDEGLTLETSISFRISLRWLTYIVNSVDKTKLSCNTPTDAAPQFL